MSKLCVATFAAASLMSDFFLRKRSGRWPQAGKDSKNSRTQPNV